MNSPIYFRIVSVDTNGGLRVLQDGTAQSTAAIDHITARWALLHRDVYYASGSSKTALESDYKALVASLKVKG